MQPETDRLTSLDGIRGLAILWVFLNHVNASFITFPPKLAFLSPFLFNSGVMGVSFLFILSGFLMAYIYPTPSGEMQFLQKRYTRIFPLFLTMSVVSFLFFVYPHSAWFIKLTVIGLLAFLTRFLWVGIVKKIDAPRLSTAVFYSFLLLQVAVGIYYGVWIMRHPPAYLNYELPVLVKNATIGLVNSTLTLPLGNLVPMLDGTYWSLASEVVFYILYPVVCAPIIFYLSRKSRKIKILFVLSLFPLFAGADIISRHILVISMLQIQLFAYFVTGMVLAYLYKNRRSDIEKLSAIFVGRLNFLTVVLFFLLIVIGHFIQSALPRSLHSCFAIVYAVPFTLILAISLNKKTWLYKFLSSKMLAFIGLISYSIYLSHTSLLHMVEENIHATGLASNIFIIGVTFFITLLISYFLYKMIEAPYFLKSKAQRAKINTEHYIVSKRKIVLMLLSICLIYIGATIQAFQSDFNFFSNQYLYTNAITSPQGNAIISMRQNPLVKMHLTARDNNLGVITLHITRHGAPAPQQKDSQLIFRIKEANSSVWYAISGYNLGEIGDSPHHPFGFPSIPDSQGKTYDIELYQEPNPYEYITIDARNPDLRSVHEVNKKEFIKNPIKLIGFIIDRLRTVLADPQAEYVLLLFLPFFLISVTLAVHERRNQGKE